MPPGKTQDVLCLFCYFLFFFKTRSKSTFLCRIWSIMCPQKRTKKIMIFVFFYFLCLFLFFLVVFAGFGNKMSSYREQKRTKNIMPLGKSQDVLCLFCSFSKHVQNRRFCAEFCQKCVLKKNKKDHDFRIF